MATVDVPPDTIGNTLTIPNSIDMLYVESHLKVMMNLHPGTDTCAFSSPRPSLGEPQPVSRARVLAGDMLSSAVRT